METKTDKPEALMLADKLEQRFWITSTHYYLDRDAAAELRRLHEAHDWQYRMAGERLRRVEKLEAQCDALLEALKAVEPILTRMYGPQAAELPPMQIVRAAIKAAEQESA